ncbi:MAG: nitroreductase family protein [Opitutaceae bacterium]|nr:nitroreductase family protein [Opitutaceae bacterium]
MAGMTLMLAAKGLGYDSCPMIEFDGEAVSKLINLFDNYALSFMILVGKQTKPAWHLGTSLSNEMVLSMLFIKTPLTVF